MMTSFFNCRTPLFRFSFFFPYLTFLLIRNMQVRLLKVEFAVHPRSGYNTLEDLWDGEVEHEDKRTENQDHSDFLKCFSWTVEVWDFPHVTATSLTNTVRVHSRTTMCYRSWNCVVFCFLKFFIWNRKV